MLWSMATLFLLFQLTLFLSPSWRFHSQLYVLFFSKPTFFLFSVVCMYMGVKLPIRSCIPEENWSFLLISLRLSITFQPEVGFCEPLSHLWWEFGWFNLVEMLCTQSQTLGFHMYNDSVMFSKECFPWKLTLAYTFFPPLLPLWSLVEKGCDIYVLFRVEHPTVS